jgi:hypothetical protein
MVDSNTSFFNTTVSEDIDVTICYDGVLLVDGKIVCNIRDVITQITDKLLDEIDALNDR